MTSGITNQCEYDRSGKHGEFELARRSENRAKNAPVVEVMPALRSVGGLAREAMRTGQKNWAGSWTPPIVGGRMAGRYDRQNRQKSYQQPQPQATVF